MSSVIAEALVGTEMDQHNTFENPDNLVKTNFTDFNLNDNHSLTVNVPPMSVVSLYVQTT